MLLRRAPEPNLRREAVLAAHRARGERLSRGLTVGRRGLLTGSAAMAAYAMLPRAAHALPPQVTPQPTVPATTYFGPSGDGTAELQQIMNYTSSTVQQNVVALRGTWNLSGSIGVNPLTTSVDARGAIFNAQNVPALAQVAAGDQLNFLTTTPTIESGTATFTGGAWHLAGGKSYWYCRLGVDQANNVSITFTGTLTMNISQTPPPGATIVRTSGVITSQTYAYVTSNNGQNTSPYFVELDTTGTSAIVTACTVSATAAFTPPTGVFNIDSSANTGSEYYGHPNWPWLGGKIVGANVFQVAAFFFQTSILTGTNQSSRLTQFGTYVENCDKAWMIGDNAYAIECYGGTSIGARFGLCHGGGGNTGEVCSMYGACLSNGQAGVENGGGGRLELHGSNVDYNIQALANSYGDFTHIGGWVEMDSPQSPLNGTYPVVQQYGQAKYEDMEFLFTNSTVDPSNTALFNVRGTYASLAFDNVTAQNWISSGTNNALNAGTGPIYLAGKAWANGFSGTLRIVRGSPPFVDNPVTTIAAAGASQTIAFALSGDQTYDITLTAATCAVTLTTSTGVNSGENRRLYVLLRGGTNGGTVTFPGVVSGGNPLTIVLAASVVTAKTFCCDDNATLFALN